MNFEDKRPNHSQESGEYKQPSNESPDTENVLEEQEYEDVSDNEQTSTPAQAPLDGKNGKKNKKWSGWSALAGGLIGGQLQQ